MVERVLLLLVLASAPTFAQAYIGPGLGAGAIAAALGVLGAVFLALLAVIYYPIKRLLRKKGKDSAASKPGIGE